MPPLAWVAAVRSAEVRVDHGESVRTFDGGFFEGTWAGPPDMSALPQATTVFGSGMVARNGALVAIPPTHPFECIYYARMTDALVLSNSLPGLLAATGLQLDAAVDYSAVFSSVLPILWLIEERHDGQLRLRRQSFVIPTATVPITGWFVENLLIGPNLSTVGERRPREAPFASFSDYRALLTAAAESTIANARPYEPIVALSSGYDSTAVASVVRQAGCARSVGFATARRSPRDGGSDDSGATTAAQLGLAHVTRQRLAYLEARDVAEAEFLCAGSAGEDVVFREFEADLPKAILFSGYWAGTEFAASHRDAWRHWPMSTAGTGFGEFRLRADFFHVPLAVFGAIRPLDASSLHDRDDMAPFRVGGSYDRPIPRRLAEEAGIARGSFATSKRASNALLTRDGLDSFSPAARASITAFAAANGERLSLRRRRAFSRLDRGLLRGARALRLAPVVERLERRRTSLTHFEPQLGNLLLRWAVSVVAERYEAVERVY